MRNCPTCGTEVEYYRQQANLAELCSAGARATEERCRMLAAENANLKTQQWYLRWLEASNEIACLKAEMEGMVRKE